MTLTGRSHSLGQGRRLACSSIDETRRALGEGGLSVVEHVQSVLADIHERDPELRAFVRVADEGALRQAESADERIRSLGPVAWRRQPLLGVVISVKDLIQTEDLPTTRGSLLANRRGRFDAPAVARLRAAGAIVVGKTTTSEYGWSASTVSRVAATTRNPWDPERSAGGSSGGAAAAVSAGFCTAALGTDGAGSIRIPAAFCGVVGYKPSFGRIPYVPACADRLAHVGPLARSVRDVIALSAILAAPHPEDPDSGLAPAAPRDEPPSLRIGWIEFPGTSTEVRAVSERAMAALSGRGNQIDRIEVPFADPYDALVDLLAAAEAAGATPDDDERCDQGRLAIVQYGRTIGGATVMRAEEVRLRLRITLGQVMERYDLLAMATVPIEPFGAEAIGPPWAVEPSDLRWLAWSPATYPFNLTGQPAVTVPVGVTALGLPVGLQLVGPIGGDDLMLSSASRVEAELDSMPPLPERVTKG